MSRSILRRLLSVLLGLGLCESGAAIGVTYRVDFAASWSAETHPGAFPGRSAHFTRLVGATHNDAVTFWEPGGLATPGVENVAELGANSGFLEEVQTAINAGTAASAIDSPGLPEVPNTTSTTIIVDESHPLITLASMVAPSPDWFVGVSGLSLHENDQWLPQVEVELFPYDAGTEDGMEFSLSNPPTSPQEVIQRITTGPLADLPALGTLTFTAIVPEVRSLTLLLLALTICSAVRFRHPLSVISTR